MNNIMIFGGTSEGRKIASCCDSLGIPAILSVATEYGKEVLPEFKNIVVRENRLNTHEIADLIINCQISCVIDATHPYAFEISENIRLAIDLLSASANVRLIRVIREKNIFPSDKVNIIEFKSHTEAASYLEKTFGNILLTTGSKDVAAYKNISERIYARVLPTASSINVCTYAGIAAKNIIAMQGPFSAALNAALIKEFSCKYLVSKLSGKSGGFYEKLEAVRLTDIVMIVIMPQAETAGVSLLECIKIIKDEYAKD